ncbi:MAG: Uma2 family endonuclease [Isosphaeraceae bacterium]
MSTAEESKYTPAEYLAFERNSPIRHEYHRGELFAMTGASREHNLISLNLGREISGQLIDRPCEAYVSDMRVQVEATGLYTYPDVVVVCGQPEFEDKQVDTLLNPTVVFEVLSESTEAYDLGVKFGNYRRIRSLREYVLVSQDRMMVERFARRGGEWVLTDYSQPDQSLELDSIGCKVVLERIYAKVQFPEKARPAPE